MNKHLPTFSAIIMTFLFTTYSSLFLQSNQEAGAPMAGTNVWIWGGEGRGQHPDDRWLPGDPFVGDPPQEPQGFNSIYDSDSTTIAILKDHAGKMELLNRMHFPVSERR